jgi:hypothetical protein
MIPVLILTALAFTDPRIVYTKSFPGSDPAYVEIAVDSSGVVAYKEAPDDDDPETFKLATALKDQVFDLAGKLGHFSHPIESGLKVANMGVKTFRWENGAEKHEVKFNYSLDLDAQALHNWFERITDSERLLLILRRAVRHDHLGVNEAVVNVQACWQKKQLVGAGQFLPLLDQVAKSDVFMHMARERAAEVAEAIRAAQPKSE